MTGPADAPAARAGAPGCTLVDAHAHLHRGVSPGAWLEAARVNFSAAAAALGRPLEAGVLLLAQPAGDEGFARLAAGLRDAPDRKDPGGWSLGATGEEVSLAARRAEGAPLLVVAGRQVRTAEGLEVLALGTWARLDEGRPVREALAAAAAAGALPVLPWGVGKWLGRRGAIVRRLIEQPGAPFLIGDTAHRPAFWPRPRLLRDAERHGLRVLPGSDPLPLPSEAGRAGCRGFALEGTLPPERPWAALRARLADPGETLAPFGGPEGAARFLRNQLRLRLRPLG